MQIKKSAVVFGLAILFLVPFASAGFFDFMTGKLSAQDEQVNISVGNTAPQIIYVEGTNANPTEESSKDVTFSVNVYDHDLKEDINTSSVTATFSKGGTTRSTTCNTPATVNANTLSFSCTITMWYWDAAASDWTVSVSAKDLSGVEATNNTQTFTYNSLTAFKMSPTLLTWSEILPSATNQKSNNDPTVLNNTGNYVVSAGNIKINATDLAGEIVDTKIIYGSNFTVSKTLDSECSGDALSSSAYVGVTGADLGTGNLSAGGVAQQNVYYCIPKVPPTVTKQAYSTTKNGAWTVKIV